jgi:hypothetical protein
MATINFIEVTIANVVSFIKSKIHNEYGTVIATVKWCDQRNIVCSIFAKIDENNTNFTQIELDAKNGPVVTVGDKISVALKGAKFEVVATPKSKYATYKVKSSADFRIFKKKDCGEVIESGTF